MTEKHDLTNEDIIKSINRLEEKINSFSEILQTFGLDIITQFGKNTHNLRILIDKINELDKTTIEIKGLTPQLTKIIDNQNIVESEIELMQSLIQRSSISLPQDELEIKNIERDITITKNKQVIRDKFNELIKQVDETDDKQIIKKKLEEIKEIIFELTGGHKITYEILQIISKLNNASSLTNSLKEIIKEKIGFWINKL